MVAETEVAGWNLEECLRSALARRWAAAGAERPKANIAARRIVVRAATASCREKNFSVTETPFALATLFVIHHPIFARK